MAANMRNDRPHMRGADLELVAYDGEPTIDEIIERAIIGDAETVAERIAAEAQDFGISHLSVFMQIAAIPYDLALQSLEDFCANVIPMVKKAIG
jgi:alkanesulfonate monooxygenase SsuD/methylene tetrahydromethanopterin reductase-like flavin-dependent oxidoreductase (luciferase family)